MYITPSSDCEVPAVELHDGDETTCTASVGELTADHLWVRVPLPLNNMVAYKVTVIGESLRCPATSGMAVYTGHTCDTWDDSACSAGPFDVCATPYTCLLSSVIDDPNDANMACHFKCKCQSHDCTHVFFHILSDQTETRFCELRVSIINT